MNRSSIFITGILLIVCIGVTGCDEQPVKTSIKDKRLTDAELKVHSSEQVEEGILLFGFDIRSSLQEDARQYLPFLAYLEQATGYKFKLRFTAKDGKIVDDLGTGVIHFAAVGATSYIKAAEKYNVKPLVGGLNKEGKAEYRSYLVVRPDSKIKDLTDLYHQRFAFGSRTSTQGYLLPRIILYKNKIRMDDLKGHFFTGSHQRCAETVIAGKADVCGMQDTMAEDLARRGLVRILYRSEAYPSSGIAVNGDVPVEIQQKVKQALLDFDPIGKHAARLYHWDKTEMPKGFVSVTDLNYQKLRVWLQKLKISTNSAFNTQKTGSVI